MIDVLRWIIGLAFTVAAVLFAVANRTTVSVVWSPVNNPTSLPVYALVLGGAGLGFFLGGFLVWLDAATLRRDRRHQRKKINALERQLEAPDDAP